jgi:hypothetical protein
VFEGDLGVGGGQQQLAKISIWDKMKFGGIGVED